MLKYKELTLVCISVILGVGILLSGCSKKKEGTIIEKKQKIRYANWEVYPAQLKLHQEVVDRYGAIIDRIKYSPVVYADETGWKVFGVETMNWCLWCFCNSEAAYYYIDRHRSSEVVRRLLGGKIVGILVTDFYSSYNKIEAKKQKCLVHVLRDIKNYLEEETADRLILNQIKEGLEWIIEKGLELQKDAGTVTAECIAWQINRQLLKERLDGLCKLESEDENAARLIKRLERFKGELLTFADYPVEYHNDYASYYTSHVVLYSIVKTNIFSTHIPMDSGKEIFARGFI